jgi:lysophospholipase L1-like esterase
MKQKSLTGYSLSRLLALLSLVTFFAVGCTAEDLRFWDTERSAVGERRGDDATAPSPSDDSQLSPQGRSWLPTEMVVIGDSIASGLLGGTKMGDVAPNEYLKYFANYSSLRENLLSLGEEDRGRYSPFTGKFLTNSIESRLSAWNPDLAVFNPSIPGATSWDAEAMIAKGIELGYSFELAFVEIGHNDFCMSNSTVEAYRAQYRKNLQTILAHNPHARLVLTSLLHIPSVFAVGPESATAAKLNTWSGFRATCSQVRDTMEHACDGWFEGKRNQFPAYVKVISDLAAEMQKAYPEARIVVADGFSDASFVQTDSMAFDCFHPNRFGYSRYSEALWADLVESGLLN